MVLEDMEVPPIAANEALVRIHAAGVNFTDIYHRTGAYASALPLTPGVEAAGVVEAVGADVTDVRVGDRVAYYLNFPLGAYAAYQAVPATRLVPLPNAVSFEQGAAAMVQALTAHYLTCSTYPLRPGETCLIHAAAGGTGALTVQMAKHRGARVIGTVSTEAKVQVARDAGADEVVVYAQQDFEAEVKRLTDGQGVEVVYDSVGKDTFEKSLNCLKPRGFMVLFGQSSGAVSAFSPQMLNTKGSLYLTRPTLANYIGNRAELLSRAQDIFDWVGAGTLKLNIDRSFPLEQAADAHRYLEGRQSKGKIVLIPGSS